MTPPEEISEPEQTTNPFDIKLFGKNKNQKEVDIDSIFRPWKEVDCFPRECPCIVPDEFRTGNMCYNEKTHNRIKVDFSTVAWGDIFLDGIGALGDLTVILQPGTEGLETVKVLKDLGMLTDLTQVSYDLTSFLPNTTFRTDKITTVLDIISLVPEVGIFASGFDVIYQLSFSLSLERVID